MTQQYVYQPEISQESNDIFRSFIVVKEMLQDRNIDISILESTSDNELHEIIKNAKEKDIFQIKVNQELNIIYHMKPTFKKQEIKTFLKQIDNIQDKKLIFIFKAKIHHNNDKNIRDLIRETKYEVFAIKNLLFNVTKHNIVPKHLILTPEQTSDVMNLYAVKNRSQFPKILSTDPIARYYDMKPGQLVKITRSSTATGENISYRFCV
jgi:DNA-directed RNA polymerase I, II, and III subunit RPABC1